MGSQDGKRYHFVEASLSQSPRS